MRIGFGYDVHRLVADRKLVIGGVVIPFAKGLLGHSDADVLCHAIGDALLGAAGLGDLGHYFPSDDEKYLHISSLILLQEIYKLLNQSQWQIINIDSAIVAESPRLHPFIDQMKDNLATILNLKTKQISIKVTTSDGLGFIGSGDGIAAYAVALLEKQ